MSKISGIYLWIISGEGRTDKNSLFVFFWQNLSQLLIFPSKIYSDRLKACAIRLVGDGLLGCIKKWQLFYQGWDFSFFFDLSVWQFWRPFWSGCRIVLGIGNVYLAVKEWCD